jgi:hypothetical protein
VIEATIAGYLFLHGKDASPGVGWIRVGPTEELEQAGVTLVENVPAYVVATPKGLIGLYAKSPQMGEPVTYCASSGWFEDAAHGSKFDALGDYVLGPAPQGLDRPHRPFHRCASRDALSQTRRVLRGASRTLLYGRIGISGPIALLRSSHWHLPNAPTDLPASRSTTDVVGTEASRDPSRKLDAVMASRWASNGIQRVSQQRHAYSGRGAHGSSFVRRDGRGGVGRQPLRVVPAMIADVAYAAAWVFDMAFVTWVAARLWEAADAGQPIRPPGEGGR